MYKFQRSLFKCILISKYILISKTNMFWRLLLIATLVLAVVHAHREDSTESVEHRAKNDYPRKESSSHEIHSEENV